MFNPPLDEKDYYILIVSFEECLETPDEGLFNYFCVRRYNNSLDDVRIPLESFGDVMLAIGSVSKRFVKYEAMLDIVLDNLQQTSALIFNEGLNQLKYWLKETEKEDYDFIEKVSFINELLKSGCISLIDTVTKLNEVVKAENESLLWKSQLAATTFTVPPQSYRRIYRRYFRLSMKDF